MDFVSNKKKRILFRLGLVCFCLLTAAGTGIVSWCVKSGAYNVIKKETIDFWDSRIRKSGLTTKNLRIIGNARTKKNQIIKATGYKENISIFSINIKTGLQNLEKLPWIKKAEIQRILPDTITIEIYEKIPIAIWQNKKYQYIPVDNEGNLIKTNIKGLKGLIIITGSDAPENVPELISTLNDNPEIKNKVKAAQRISNRRWNLILNDIKDGITVLLPENDMHAAFAKLSEIDRKHHIINDQIELIDLRIKDRIRLRFKENSNEVLWTA